MNIFRHICVAVLHGARAVLAFVAALAILWAISYRLILGFTPVWLDVATIVAAGIAALILLVLGRGKARFQYPLNKSKPK
jgi:hypothetical protein